MVLHHKAFESCGDPAVQRRWRSCLSAAAVVDDDMGITEVVRMIRSSTPRQLYLQDMLGLSSHICSPLPTCCA